MASGYVYIVKDIDVSGYCKIGHSKSPTRRIADFGIILPFETMVVMLIWCKDASKFESNLHHMFASNRRNGEWFKLNDAEITYARLTVEYWTALSKYAPNDQARIWEYCEQKRLELSK